MECVGKSRDQFSNFCLVVYKKERRKFTIFWQKMTSEEIRNMGLPVSHGNVGRIPNTARD